jgi:phosphatidylglycerophosphate synthase
MQNENKIRRWNLGHAGLMALSLLLSLTFENVAVVVLMALLSFVTYIVLHQKDLALVRPFGGYANWVTAFRFLLTIVLGLIVAHLSKIQIAMLATAIVSLDGLDGYLARKFKTQSLFGAYLDMETDAFYVALMSLILYHCDYVPGWILLPGFLRYFYVVFIRLIAYHKRTEKRLKFTQVIAVVFFISLILPFVIAREVYEPLLGVVSVAIVISFAYSFYSILNFKRSED